MLCPDTRLVGASRVARLDCTDRCPKQQQPVAISAQPRSFLLAGFLSKILGQIHFHPIDRKKVPIGCAPKIQPIDQNVGAYRLLMIPSYTQYLLIHNTFSSRHTILWFPVNAQTPEVSALFKRAVSVLSALCQCALDGD